MEIERGRYFQPVIQPWPGITSFPRVNCLTMDADRLRKLHNGQPALLSEITQPTANDTANLRAAHGRLKVCSCVPTVFLNHYSLPLPMLFLRYSGGASEASRPMIQPSRSPTNRRTWQPTTPLFHRSSQLLSELFLQHSTEQATEQVSKLPNLQHNRRNQRPHKDIGEEGRRGVIVLLCMTLHLS